MAARTVHELLTRGFEKQEALKQACILSFARNEVFHESRKVRPYSNDQTLFVKHLKLPFQAKYFTVWQRRKNVALQTFLIPSSNKCFLTFS